MVCHTHNPKALLRMKKTLSALNRMRSMPPTGRFCSSASNGAARVTLQATLKWHFLLIYMDSPHVNISTQVTMRSGDHLSTSLCHLSGASMMVQRKSGTHSHQNEGVCSSGTKMPSVKAALGSPYCRLFKSKAEC